MLYSVGQKLIEQLGTHVEVVAISSVGRASPLKGDCRRFKSFVVYNAKTFPVRSESSVILSSSNAELRSPTARKAKRD